MDIEIRNPEGYEEYERAAAPTLAAYGGRDVVRGGATRVLEGTSTPHRVVAANASSSMILVEWLGS